LTLFNFENILGQKAIWNSKSLENLYLGRSGTVDDVLYQPYFVNARISADFIVQLT
jgi:hypothetical protein